MPEWKIVRMDYKNVPGEGGNVVVTILHWECIATELKDPAPTDPEEDLYYRGRMYGALPEGNNRVYTIPALSAVPASVVLGWLHAAMDSDPESPTSDEVEAEVLARIERQKAPEGGSIVPS